MQKCSSAFEPHGALRDQEGRKEGDAHIKSEAHSATAEKAQLKTRTCTRRDQVVTRTWSLFYNEGTEEKVMR